MNNVDYKSINALRALGIDGINKANSGHPGMVLGAAPMAYTLFSKHLRTNPNESNWINRDRFILAAGHGSMLLYSLLHLSGFNLTIEDLKNFRQWNSKTPGHPEYKHTDGIDATSGPLGQGIAMAAGMALAEEFLSAKFNKDNMKVIDHYTYALCGDGDLQEGVTQEAMSLAGHLGLAKLIVLYDSNDIQLDGEVSLANSEDVKTKYESMNWHYIKVNDGNSVEEINKAIFDAQDIVDQPTIIEIKTTIGFGSPLAGDSAAHGAPLGVEKGKVTKETLEWSHDEFHVPNDVYENFDNTIKARGINEYSKWNDLFKTYEEKYPELALELKSAINGELNIDFDSLKDEYEVGMNEATRATGGKILNKISEAYSLIIGGSADLTKSTKAKGFDGDFNINNRLGRNLNFGVREHAMGAMVNGITLHGALKAFSGAFFVFSDYMKPAIRMAALMNIPSIFAFTHDSIAVGEDGPTHEPIEQLVGLRSIPNLDVIRPADANETFAAWQLALESKDNPHVLVFTRQNVRTMAGTSYEGVKRGGYVVSKEQEKIDAILIAAGSEVNLAVDTQKELLSEGIDTRVVSLPSFKRFLAQDASYIEEVLPIDVRNRVGIEMGSSYGWSRFVGLDGKLLTIDTFGASAPGSKVIEEYGFTVENLKNIVKELVK